MSSHSSSLFWVIIPAAGIGSRMRLDHPKQYLEIENKTILEHSLDCFLSRPEFKGVYVGISDEDAYFKQTGLDVRAGLKIFSGGKERSHTVLNGLDAISDEANVDDWVWVHDAARPCLSHSDIDLLIQALEQQKSGLVLGVPITDTLKRVSENKSSTGLPSINHTIDRSGLWRAMTPQIFKYGDLRNALELCQRSGHVVTDEASAIEYLGLSASMVHGSDHNIKVTLPADLDKATEYVKKKQSRQVGLNQAVLNKGVAEASDESIVQKNSNMFPKIGTGFDVHAFGDGSFVTLGGEQIPYDKGLVAHSDGDVLLHAIADALLGALALGDIGKHFPDTDAKWKGANSRDLLKAVNTLIHKKGYSVGNIDTTIIAQAPKMAPHITCMRQNIAEDLKLDMSCVAVKATTSEKLGFTGRKEGIACQASVLLMPINADENND